MTGAALHQRLALAAYGLLMTALVPLLWWRTWWRARREPGYGHAIAERFGRYRAQPIGRGAIWIHAVSLGETRAAAVLMAALRSRCPDMRFLLTHSTATGREAGLALLRPGDQQTWLPWDSPGAVRRFLQHHRPRAGLLMETEVWPQLVAGCAVFAVPLWLVSGRLAQRSARRAAALGWLSRPAFRGLQAVLPQTPEDAERFQAMGAHVTAPMGNLKYDIALDPEQLARGRGWRVMASRRPVVMLASTRPGEEALWLQACQRSAAAGRVQWLVVPRHPQRFDEVAALMVSAGLRVKRRSAFTEAVSGLTEPLPAHGRFDEVWLGDSVGEMQAYCALASVALLGGSFLPYGGQNLIEAIACDCPVVMGPHTFNFAGPAALAEGRGAAWRCEDIDAAVERAVAMARDEAALQRAQAACRQVMEAGRGSAAACVGTLLADPHWPSLAW